MGASVCLLVELKHISTCLTSEGSGTIEWISSGGDLASLLKYREKVNKEGQLTFRYQALVSEAEPSIEPGSGNYGGSSKEMLESFEKYSGYSGDLCEKPQVAGIGIGCRLGLAISFRIWLSPQWNNSLGNFLGTICWPRGDAVFDSHPMLAQFQPMTLALLISSGWGVEVCPAYFCTSIDCNMNVWNIIKEILTPRSISDIKGC